jgi:hypothetical protein
VTGRGEQHPTLKTNYKLKNELAALRSNGLYGASNVCTNYFAFRRPFISVYAVSISFIRAVASTSRFRSEFQMAHELASAFQQALGIGNLVAAERPR